MRSKTVVTTRSPMRTTGTPRTTSSISPWAAVSKRGRRISTVRSASTVPRSPDRKSTRLNTSHVSISYAVIFMKKKKENKNKKVKQLSKKTQKKHDIKYKTK